MAGSMLSAMHTSVHRELQFVPDGIVFFAQPDYQRANNDACSLIIVMLL
jgi:hypothetical protein